MVAEYDSNPQTNTGETKYLMSNVQGLTRVITDNSGNVIARRDYQAFGREIGAGIGLRTPEQKYDASESTRQKYALTERDEATGLEHTWWRKYESSAGRWTTPDPYNGSMTIDDPQSFNRYAYVSNDPVNLADPTGLFTVYILSCRTRTHWVKDGGLHFHRNEEICEIIPIFVGPISPPGGGGGGGTTEPPGQTNKPCSVSPLTPITDPIAQKFEQGGGNEIDLTGFTSETAAAFICLTVSVIGVGGNLTLNSGFRPPAYQANLKEIWDKAKLLENNREPACQQLRTQVLNERTRHNLAEPPAQNSNHSKGKAFDASFSNIGGKTVKNRAKECGLGQSKHPNGAHHFMLLPTPSCGAARSYPAARDFGRTR